VIKHAQEILTSTIHHNHASAINRNNNDEIETNAMIVGAPQGLADRRSTNIADVVPMQTQFLQGGIVPVQVHTLNTVACIRKADQMLFSFFPKSVQETH
jgi:hypothetical protein